MEKTDIISPDSLSGQKLDAYLARGWRTTGQSVYFSEYLWLRDKQRLISLLPLRLSLPEHRFSKSMRKLLRRNLQRYRVEYGPARRAGESEQLANLAYLRERPDRSLIDLDYHIRNLNGYSPLNTWQCRVYDGPRLVAFSYFDLGETSAYGKADVFDPAYARDSLGLFTLILEVEFCRRMDLRYYYPGYVSTDDPLFDYKHRLGTMDFYSNHDARWHPFQPGEARVAPLDRLLKELSRATEMCKKRSLPEAELMLYPHQNVHLNAGHNPIFLDVPAFVWLRSLSATRFHLLRYRPDCQQWTIESAVARIRGAAANAIRDPRGLNVFSMYVQRRKKLLESTAPLAEVLTTYLNSYGTRDTATPAGPR